MRITQETLTVIADAQQREISVLLSGLRITLDGDEAHNLADQLTDALGRIAADGREDTSRRAPVRAQRPARDEAAPDNAVPGLNALVDKAI